MDYIKFEDDRGPRISAHEVYTGISESITLHYPTLLYPKVSLADSLRYLKFETYLPFKTKEGKLYFQHFIRQFYYQNTKERENSIKHFEREVLNFILLHEVKSEEDLDKMKDLNGDSIYNLTYSIRKLNGDL